MIDETLPSLRREIPEYRNLRDESHIADVREAIEENAQIWYGVFLEGRLPPSSRLKPLEEFARRRVHQGIPLDAVLRSYRVGIGVFWKTLVDVGREEPVLQEELLLRLSPYVLVHSDLTSWTVHQAYQAEITNRLRWRDRLKHELADAVFAPERDEVDFSSRLGALGLDEAVPRVALAVRVRRDLSDPAFSAGDLGDLASSC